MNLVNSFREISVPLTAAIISAAINEPFADVQAAIAPEGMLMKSGAIILVKSVIRFSDKIFLRWGLLDLAVTPGLTRDRILSRLLSPAGRTCLTKEDYSHMSEEINLAINLIEAALQHKTRGVNLLFHGPTGTGKTELARLIGQTLNVDTFMVQGTDDAGGNGMPQQRISSLLIGQRLLRNARSLMVFDETEDLFTPAARKESEYIHNGLAVSKQWIVSFLETNEVPVLWITNSLSNMERAIRRRFTYSIEFHGLTQHNRARVFTKHISDAQTITEADIKELSHYNCNPAQIATSISAARLISEGKVNRKLVERFLAQAEKLVDGGEPGHHPIIQADSYRLDIINCSEDLEALTSHLVQWRQSKEQGISLFLYGPSGTGKSEYAKYLANKMGLQIICRYGSDIQNKWVGDTEKNIANAFREAESQNALLLFDEVDTFLRSREGASHQWEVSCVNEFLQQLERYRGVIACTTNVWKEVDAAALRRFVFKIEFRPLRLNQAVELFQALFKPILAENPDPNILKTVREELGRYPMLTPGDFAAVSRRVRVLGQKPGIEELIELLKRELEAKHEKHTCIGFSSI